METFQDVQDLLRRTGASAAMSSEGLLEVPNLFVNPRYPQDMTPRQIFLQQVQFCRDYLDVAQQYPPLPGVLGAYGSWTIARGHLIKFLHRYLQHDEELARDLRDALLLTSSSSSSTKTASQGRYNCYCVADAYRLIDELQRRYDQLTWEEWEQLPSSRHYTSWYRRHWPDSQVYHNRPINEHDDSSRTGPKLIVMTTKAMMVEERKRQIQARIDQLQKERFARDAVEVQQEDYKAVA
jgi:tRNA-dihydrouridine synthase